MNQNGKNNTFFNSCKSNEKNEDCIIRTIREITERGNDAEVRRKPDGTYAVYEVKKRLTK